MLVVWCELSQLHVACVPSVALINDKIYNGGFKAGILSLVWNTCAQDR